jgi:hypothetical protein
MPMSILRQTFFDNVADRCSRRTDRHHRRANPAAPSNVAAPRFDYMT